MGEGVTGEGAQRGKGSAHADNTQATEEWKTPADTAQDKMK